MSNAARRKAPTLNWARTVGFRTPRDIGDIEKCLLWRELRSVPRACLALACVPTNCLTFPCPKRLELSIE